MIDWQIWSNNPQERLNKEIRRRTDVVGIFPKHAQSRPANHAAPERRESSPRTNAPLDQHHRPQRLTYIDARTAVDQPSHTRLPTPTPRSGALGRCGTPCTETCEHANACLYCPLFITTPDYLPVLREQRDEHATMMQLAEAEGHQRIVERNRKPFVALSKLIDNLEEIVRRRASEESQIA